MILTLSLAFSVVTFMLGYFWGGQRAQKLYDANLKFATEQSDRWRSAFLFALDSCEKMKGIFDRYSSESERIAKKYLGRTQ